MLFMYILTNVFFIFSIYSFMILLIYIARLLRFSVEPTIAIFPFESKILFTYIELLAIKGFYRPWSPDWNQATVFILYVWKNANMIRMVQLKSLRFLIKKGL